MKYQYHDITVFVDEDQPLGSGGRLWMTITIFYLPVRDIQLAPSFCVR
jgi:hypothetical protein